MPLQPPTRAEYEAKAILHVRRMQRDVEAFCESVRKINPKQANAETLADMRALNADLGETLQKFVEALPALFELRRDVEAEERCRILNDVDEADTDENCAPVAICLRRLSRPTEAPPPSKSWWLTLRSLFG